MIPDYYACSSCHQKFEFDFQEACYYLGTAPVGPKIAGGHILNLLVRPAWCKECGIVCMAEDIPPLRVLEKAYGAARAGHPIEYPVRTEGMDAAEAEGAVGAYLGWRMKRQKAARVLCCGRSNHQFMDVEQPLLKHAECEFGFIQAWFSISGHNGWQPGVRSAANIRLYDPEGELIGRLTWYCPDEDQWIWDPMAYPQAAEED